MALLDDPIEPGGTLMHHRIDTILKRLRQDLAHRLEPESIQSVCRSVGHTWRKSLLNPVAVIHWFVTQILHGNSSLQHVTLLAGRIFTDSAYCQARAHLPLAVFRGVLRELVKALLPQTRVEGTWRGHRTWLIDGSSFSMPDTPELQAKFGQPGAQAKGCGFPVAKILALFHAGTGVLIEVVAAPLRTHEMSRLGEVHPALEPSDVLVGDRGLCSFAHLAMLVRDGFHGVFRVHQRQIVDFTPNRPHARQEGQADTKGLPRSRWLRRLGVLDQVVEWFKPKERPEWMGVEEYEALPETLVVRELRYEVGGRGFRTRTVTLVTTLVDEGLYPLDALANLYGMRWRVELNLRHLKTTMKMDVLKCKTVDGVLKELTAFAIVYNLVRVVMIEASHRQGVDVERISFVDALRWLEQAEPGDDLPKLVVNPDRPNRFEPRVRKRRPKQYPLMRKPRSELRKALLENG
jgi:Transposase DDE domain